jgi:hypothetical protein
MSKPRLSVTLAAALLLAAASAAPAQSQNRRGDRRDRYNRDGGRSDRTAATSQASSQPYRTSGATTRPGGPMDDQYAVLLNRSIFARSGRSADVRAPDTAATRTTQPVLSPEQAVVFVGVIAADDEFVAYAENQVSHQLMVLRAGDDVAHGKVVAITLDTLAYGTGGAIKEVHLGQNLAGELVSGDLVGGATGGGSSTSTSSAPSTAGMTPEQAAIIERLRKRRESGQ